MGWLDTIDPNQIRDITMVAMVEFGRYRRNMCADRRYSIFIVNEQFPDVTQVESLHKNLLAIRESRRTLSIGKSMVS